MRISDNSYIPSWKLIDKLHSELENSGVKYAKLADSVNRLHGVYSEQVNRITSTANIQNQITNMR